MPAAVALGVMLAAGCAVSKKRVLPPVAAAPALTATKAELIARYDGQARAVETLEASVNLAPRAGSALSGAIEQYHDLDGFILAARPAFIRVIGQAPVVRKDVFDMVSDGRTFRIFIPSKNKFIVGPTALPPSAKKPIENLRPQHLLEALLWPEIPAGAPVLFEETASLPERYYVLTVVKPMREGWTLDRKIWFERTDLNVSRIQIYGPGGRIFSDVSYGNWEAAGKQTFPRRILLARPQDDYQLGIRITQVTLDLPISADRFTLAQPPGAELVRLGEEKTGERR